MLREEMESQIVQKSADFRRKWLAMDIRDENVGVFINEHCELQAVNYLKLFCLLSCL